MVSSSLIELLMMMNLLMEMVSVIIIITTTIINYQFKCLEIFVFQVIRWMVMKMMLIIRIGFIQIKGNVYLVSQCMEHNQLYSLFITEILVVLHPLWVVLFSVVFFFQRSKSLFFCHFFYSMLLHYLFHHSIYQGIICALIKALKMLVPRSFQFWFSLH